MKVALFSPERSLTASFMSHRKGSLSCFCDIPGAYPSKDLGAASNTSEVTQKWDDSTRQAEDTMLAAVNPWLSKETSLFKALNY